MRKFGIFAALLVGAAALFSFRPSEAALQSEKLRLSPNGISGRFIVVMNETSGESSATDAYSLAAEAGERRGTKVDHVFTSALVGFSAEMSESDALRLSQDPRVAYVEQDVAIEAQATQTAATWGISRIDQHPFASPLDSNYNYQATGTGVNVYIVDTGVLVTHPDFGGRAVTAFDSYNENVDISQCNGHGTHVAGTVGSNTYGVAKGVRIYSVKVFPCYGGTSSSSVIAGIDWINRNAVRPAVVNMSLGGSVSSTLDQAIRNSIGRGIVYVVAAGNDSDDACNHSPADVSEAITVGATGRSDSRDETTNYGRCIDIFAPGVAIDSTWNQYPLPYATFTMSGTSTASPHVAGIAALYLELNPAAAPMDVSRAIVSNATVDAVYNPGTGSPNLLAYSLFSREPSGCAAFTGALATTGSSDFQSSSSGFTGRSGVYKATLNVPAGARFQLGLQLKKGSRWTDAAVSSGTSSVESISFGGKSGTYRWSILSLAGGGAYSMCSTTP